MRPTSFSGPATDRGLIALDAVNDPRTAPLDLCDEADAGGRSLLGRSAGGRLAYLSLLLAALWAGVTWALH